MLDIVEVMKAWRHDLHKNPEIGFDVSDTAEYIATQLRDMNIEVVTGVGKTGLVGTLKRGADDAVSVAIRGDMDALEIHEASQTLPYASKNPGRMHACGHDGHMAIVLGAAKLLSSNENFVGTVRFIFQPDEESGAGAKAMLKDGLLERFPFNEIYGFHNLPGLSVGKISTRVGGIMASEDHFDIKINGRGTHAARPHLGIDPLVIAAEIILRIQSVVSREIDPSEPVVISCTEISGDGIRNAIPNYIKIGGNVRSYSPKIQDFIKEKLSSIASAVCSCYGATFEYDYRIACSPTVNWKKQTDLAIEAAVSLIGNENVEGSCDPLMISEDFGAFLEVVPGCFSFLGNGDVEEGVGCVPLHDAKYDFNDNALLTGAKLLERTVLLSLEKQRMAK